MGNGGEVAQKYKFLSNSSQQGLAAHTTLSAPSVQHEQVNGMKVQTKWSLAKREYCNRT
jgi:hypothetical protein